MKRFIKNYWAVFIPIIVLIVALVYFFRNNSTNRSTEGVIGMVDAESVDVSSSLPGRVLEILVKEGDTVVEGQVLVKMKASELETIRSQVVDAVVIAQNQLDKVQRGVEPEVLASAKNLEEIARQQMTLMTKTYDRFQTLYGDGVISGQERDLVYFKYKAAQKELETAHLNVQLLQRGNNAELKKSAQAILNQSQDAEKLVDQLKDNTIIRAPISGIIATLIVKPSEMANAGYPMMTIQKGHSFFVKFNLRQDQMSKIDKGTKVLLDIPGCTPDQVGGTVFELSTALGYADWVPEKQNGEFELRTFQIKVRPDAIQSIKGLSAGMTARLNYK